MAKRNRVLELVPPASSSPTHTPGPQPAVPEFLRPDEDPQAWKEFSKSWFDDYRPGAAPFEYTVRRLVKAVWMLERAEAEEQAFENALYGKHGCLSLCSDEEKKKLQFFATRRKEAEQSAHRYRSAAEQMRRSRRIEASQQQRADRPKKEANPEPAESSDAAPCAASDVHSEPAPFLQSIHIEERDGITRTILNPENQFLYAMIRELGKDGQPVHRTLHFPDRIPLEYLWATLGKETVPKRVRWILSQSRFQEEMIREEEQGTGHLVPDFDQYSRETILLG